ncbi:MAG TPA: RraA family protein [Candidatus Blautia faecavium]|uniref:RraA family protein n=1 Tax=Candidatus Blautia faecavium TaxID=2838487 RepID=A0A9D2LRI1_9FIRM|nr:RraA family protein [Candidatus Blautia faecavium]
MNFNVKEDIIQLTEKWTGERLPDGRPKVSDEDLEEIRNLTLEEVWQPLFLKGYLNQFEEKLKRLHDDKRKLVGRAVTCSFMPARPDLEETVKKIGASEGRKGTCNQWVIDTLMEGDVVVADMYDKIYEGTFVGGNLSTAIKNRTKTGGAVVWGGIRDLEQIEGIPDLQIYYRGVDPTPIRNFVMTSFNSMTKIGGAVCLPGDVVYGYGGGVIFIPSHMVKEVIEFAKKMHVKDIFGFEMIRQGVYTTADIDIDIWPTEMMERLIQFIETDERGEKYRSLDWSKELEDAKREEQC